MHKNYLFHFLCTTRGVIRLVWHQENEVGGFLSTRWCLHPPGAPWLPGAGGAATVQKAWSWSPLCHALELEELRAASTALLVLETVQITFFPVWSWCRICFMIHLLLLAAELCLWCCQKATPAPQDVQLGHCLPILGTALGQLQAGPGGESSPSFERTMWSLHWWCCYQQFKTR